MMNKEEYKEYCYIVHSDTSEAIRVEEELAKERWVLA